MISILPYQQKLDALIEYMDDYINWKMIALTNKNFVLDSYFTMGILFFYNSPLNPSFEEWYQHQHPHLLNK